MGFFANQKAKRAAKQAQAIYDAKLHEWTLDHDVLTNAITIFNDAAKGEEPADNQLVQKPGELVLWSGTATFHEAGRTPSHYVGSTQGFSIPIVAGVRYRVSSTRGTLIPGDEMQMEKERGLVKLTNQRIIFAGSANASEWQFAKFLSASTNPDRSDYIFAVSNRKKTSGLKFSVEDGVAFGRLFALALYSFEKGIPATIKAIKEELKNMEAEKPKLVIEPPLT